MERSLLKELSKKTITAFVDRAREAYLKKLFWNMFFVLKYTSQLTWESLSGSSGAPVMADVVEYNATAPLKTRRTIAKAHGDIPKIALKRKMDEKDYNDYLTAKALATGDENAVALLDIIFGDVDFCYQGVLARTEFLCMQALSYGKLTLDATNNNGIITETDVDFGIPSGNKTAVGVIWSTAASATPLADIGTVVDTAEAAGRSVKYVVMDKATFNYLKATTEAKDAWSTFQGVGTGKKSRPTLADINTMHEANLLPTIIVVNSSVRFEDENHALTTVAPWKTGYVTFIPDAIVGNFKHGPIAEENAPAVAKQSIMVKRDHILITKWSDLEPFGEWTKGQANAFPVFNDVDGIYILKTNGTSWS
jgi:hypothetical protein